MTCSVVFIWPYDGESVQLAGSFSHWDHIPLNKSGDRFETLLDLAPGTYEYKFIVDNDWLVDDALPLINDDHGGYNNVVIIQHPSDNKNEVLKIETSKPVTKEGAVLAPEVEEKFHLLLSVGEECVTEPELANLLAKKPKFNLYDGFEPSGRMHIAQGVFKAMNVNKCTKAGGTFIFWVADWFALMNDKMGGDLDKIQTVGKYLIEVWKAVGMDMTNVRFLWTSEEITKHAVEYWGQALDIARRFSVARVTKCCQIMGRSENNLTAAQILYPIMQCTDIFFLKADVCQLGVDQRKVNMLAREYCDAAGIKLKPIILSHHMLYGLKKGQQKMSKSDPFSAIFMEDTDEEVRKKITAAYCPVVPEEGVDAQVGEDSMSLVVDPLKNPCLDYVRYIIFSVPGSKMEISGKTYTNFESLKENFLNGNISEHDLKESLIAALGRLIKPVREHFEQDPFAKDLLSKILSYKKEDAKIVGKFRHLKVNNSEEPWVIFAPLASAQYELSTLLTLIKQLRVPPSDAEIILWLPDWSSFTLNSLGGDKKAISAAYTLLIEGLNAIIPDLMKSVRIMFQSDAILTNPNDYWISVINVGRKFSLGQIRSVEEENPQVAQVISALMRVGDVLATGAAHIVSTSTEYKLHELAAEYYDIASISDLSKPKIHTIESLNTQLLKRIEGFDNPDIFVLPFLDATADVSRKLKKAFCEPLNVDYCPPLVLANEVALPFQKSIVIKRKPENGGDLSFTDPEALRKAFANGELHPSDLKPAVTKSLEDFLVIIREEFKKDSVKKALTDVRNYIKKADKKKK